MRSSSIVLLSGGLDSLASLHWAHRISDVMLCLTFDYGQRSASKEIEAAKSICRHYDVKHKVAELPWFSAMNPSPLLDSSLPLPKIEMSDLDDEFITKKTANAVWIPNRNGVFLNVAASIAESMLANWIVAGFNKEEAQTFPDNSQEFVETANAFFNFSTNGKIKLQAPMASKTKKEIVFWASSSGVDFSPLWSCYRGDDKMCGTCESCIRCKRAFEEAGAHQWVEKLF